MRFCSVDCYLFYGVDLLQCCRRLQNNAEAIEAIARLSETGLFVAIDAADCLLAFGKGDQGKRIENLLRDSDARNTDFVTSVRALNVLDRNQHLLSDQQRVMIKNLAPKVKGRKHGTDYIEKLISFFWTNSFNQKHTLNNVGDAIALAPQDRSVVLIAITNFFDNATGIGSGSGSGSGRVTKS